MPLKNFSVARSCRVTDVFVTSEIILALSDGQWLVLHTKNVEEHLTLGTISAKE